MGRPYFSACVGLVLAVGVMACAGPQDGEGSSGDPGAGGAKVVPDLAADLGTPSENATVWTYTLKDGLKYEDGTAITSADIKYGIERSFAAELSGGAPCLRDWLIGGADYQGPYKDEKGLDSIEVPDAKTIVFRLDKPEGEFPYLATQTQTTPVPEAKDTAGQRP